MATATLERGIGALGPYLGPLTEFNLLVAVQLFAALLYGVTVGVSTPGLSHFLLPFVWVAVAVLAVRYANVPARSRPHTVVGAAVAGGYLLLVLYLSGTVGPSTGVAALDGTSALAVEWHRSLGWGPTVIYRGDWLAARVIPYQLIGYLALAYLIYGAVLDISSSAAVGLVGLVPCPACAAPLVAPMLAGVAGTSSAVAIILPYTYEISTTLFLGAVGLLYWRPTAAELRASVGLHLAGIAAALALVVAWLHLSHPTLGAVRLLEYLRVGTLYDPRPLLFTLSALGIVVAVLLGLAGRWRSQLSLAGIALMSTFLLAYVAWHTALDHGAFWPHIQAHGHSDAGAVETVLLHLRADPRALASKLAEAALLGLLSLLYWRR